VTAGWLLLFISVSIGTRQSFLVEEKGAASQKVKLDRKGDKVRYLNAFVEMYSFQTPVVAVGVQFPVFASD